MVIFTWQELFLEVPLHPQFLRVLNIHRRLADTDVYCVVKVNAPLKKTIPVRRIFADPFVKMLLAWASIERKRIAPIVKPTSHVLA